MIILKKSFKENKKFLKNQNIYHLIKSYLLPTILYQIILKKAEGIKKYTFFSEFFKKFGIFFTLPNHDLDANFLKEKIKEFCHKNANALC